MGAWMLRWPTGVSTNKLYRPTERHGQKVLTDEAIAYREEIIATVRNYPRHLLPEGPLCFIVLSNPPDRGAHDDDNHAKFCRDSVALAYGFDDKRIRLTLSWRLEEIPHGRLVLMLLPLAHLATVIGPAIDQWFRDVLQKGMLL